MASNVSNSVTSQNEEVVHCCRLFVCLLVVIALVVVWLCGDERDSEIVPFPTYLWRHPCLAAVYECTSQFRSCSRLIEMKCIAIESLRPGLSEKYYINILPRNALGRKVWFPVKPPSFVILISLLLFATDCWETREVWVCEWVLRGRMEGGTSWKQCVWVIDDWCGIMAEEN